MPSVRWWESTGARLPGDCVGLQDCCVGCPSGGPYVISEVEMRCRAAPYDGALDRLESSAPTSESNFAAFGAYRSEATAADRISAKRSARLGYLATSRCVSLVASLFLRFSSSGPSAISTISATRFSIDFGHLRFAIGVLRFMEATASICQFVMGSDQTIARLRSRGQSSRRSRSLGVGPHHQSRPERARSCAAGTASP